MNKKYFTIFQKYRGRKYHRDLEKLRNDLSDRGLLNSGIGDEEIKMLTEDYRDEIQMKKEEVEAEKKERTGQKWSRRFSYFVNMVATLAVVFGTLLSVQTFSETKKLNRPYLSMVERGNILKFDNNGSYQILKVNIKNTGNLPAEFRTYLDGWVCTSTSRQSDSDYVLPEQEIEVGYNLLLNGCKLLTDNSCKFLEDIKLIIEYKSPGQNDFEYITSFKMKIISGVQDMLLSNATSTNNYDIKILRCGDNDDRKDLVTVWYVEQMK